MTWSKSVSFHSFISLCHWAMSRSAELRCTWTTINDITWRSGRFSVQVAFKMDALKLYGKRFLVDVLSQLESYNVRYNQFDNTTFCLDWFLGVLDRFSPTNLEDKVIIDRLIAQLQQVKAIVVKLHNDIFMGYCPQKIYSQYRGWPSFDIPEEQIELFLEYNFSLPQISEILGVSLSTVNRRLKDYGLSVTQTYSTISATELDKITQQLVSEFPNCGYRRMTGFLWARGIHVQQIRVRESMKRSDPEGVLLRSLQLTPISRRVYNVTCLLALWHLDGHHKLIRYVFNVYDKCYKLILYVYIADLASHHRNNKYLLFIM